MVGVTTFHGICNSLVNVIQLFFLYRRVPVRQTFPLAMLFLKVSNWAGMARFYFLPLLWKCRIQCICIFL